MRTEQYFFSSFKKYFNFVHRGFIKNGLLLIIFVLFEQHCATVQFNGTQTRIIGVEGKDDDHYTMTVLSRFHKFDKLKHLNKYCILVIFTSDSTS